jgi:A/G-specific adenine glycosylase
MTPPKASKLLTWYDAHARRLPWRALPGELADPYAVWLSEIMLQQTTVATVGPYFQKFLAKWPTVEDLAGADVDAVMHAWAGLGYYSRARNLHACAKAVVTLHGGVFPSSEEGLISLPGIGPYTAAAVAAIAYGVSATVVDGNVERVVARLFSIHEPMPAAKKKIREMAATLTPKKRAGDFAQAMMDLGATTCTPKRPACERCPFAKSCQALHEGDPESLPVKAPKKEKPTRRGVVFWCVRDDGAVLIRKRPPKGLLGGMMEIPSTEWLADAPGVTGESRSRARLMEQAPTKAKWKKQSGEVRHTFTHFHLVLDLYLATVCDDAEAQGEWVQADDLGDHAFPTVMKKVIALAMENAGPLFEATRRN